MPLAIRTSLLSMLVIALAAPALAQSDDSEEQQRSAMARAQFDEGVRATERGEWQRASDSFGRALELRETPQIRYNLAESLFHLGRLVEASEHVAILRRGGDLPDAVARSTVGLSERIARTIGRLTVTVRGGSQEGVQVTVDGRLLPPAVWSTETVVDPGRHVIRLRRGTVELQTEEALVPEGGSAQVELVVPDAPTPPQVAQSAMADASIDQQGAEQDDDGDAWWPWLTLGAGAAAAAIVVVLLATSASAPTPGDFDPGIVEVR